MDRCSAIEQTIQSYIDGEQSASERVIIEKHLNDCARCQGLLEAQRRCTAELFEVYASERLAGTLTPYVLEHLPEMLDLSEGKRDLAEVNQRAKHPRPFREYALKIVPVAAMFVLVFLGYTLTKIWPEPVVSDRALGSVTFADGMNFHLPEESDGRNAASLKNIALPGDRFETSSDSTMMVTLLGPTHVKVAPDARIRIQSDRRISVEKGSVFLDVAKGDRMFRVFTPSGNVTVFGTSFDVNVIANATTVAVHDGEVQVETGDLFAQLNPGDEIEFNVQSTTLVPHRVALESIAPWANAIEPDVDALHYFTTKVAPVSTNSLIQGDNAWMLTGLKGNRIGYVEVEWKASRLNVTPMGYQIYVFKSDDTLLFKGFISGTLLARETSTRIYNRTSPDARSEFAYVKVVPSYETGQGETKFTNIRAGLVQ